ncbi:MAG: MaoC family dehydratase [Dehalococcoidia bacterium]|nr:MaoC family dehydratase [Dehalococcoidia bacterium]
MTSSAPEPNARAGLETLHPGQEFTPTPLDLSREAVVGLLDSIEATLPRDENGVEIVPPSVMASLSLGVLLQHVSLPLGSLHASQEIRVLSPIPVGARALCEAVVANVSNRAGLTLVSLDFNVESYPDEAGGSRQLATGAGTVMFPAGTE